MHQPLIFQRHSAHQWTTSICSDHQENPPLGRAPGKHTCSCIRWPIRGFHPLHLWTSFYLDKVSHSSRCSLALLIPSQSSILALINLENTEWSCKTLMNLLLDEAEPSMQHGSVSQALIGNVIKTSWWSFVKVMCPPMTINIGQWMLSPAVVHELSA